jgi:recombination protein RecA
MSQALRILNPTISKTRTCMIFINQIRQKVGVFFGNPETTSGGLALKFYSSVRLEVRKAGQIKKGDETIGNEVSVKVVKNKVAPPFRQAKFELMYEGGVSKEGDVLILGQDDKIIEKKGNWLYYGDVGLGNGSEKAKEYLRENSELADEIVRRVLEKRNLLNAALVPQDGDDEEIPAELKEAVAPTPRKGRQAANAE